MKHMKFHYIKLKFVPRDLWIGLYIDRTLRGSYYNTYAIYICVLPMLPVHICWSVEK